jgi:hypothetical protein
MVLKYTKLWPVIATSLVAFTSLNADSHNGSMKSTTPSNNSYNNTMGDVKGGYDFSITAAALYWKADGEGTEFAASSGGRHVETLESDFDWGFRVGLGYRMPHDRWNIAATWDHLHVGAGDSTGDGWFGFGQLELAGGAQLGPTQSVSATDFNVSSHWHLDYDTIDLALKRDFKFSKWLCVAPHIGLRSAWIKQNQHFTFGKNEVSLGGSTPAEMKISNNFWGLGIRSGFDTTWGLGAGLSIYGNAAAALLYGVNKVDGEQVEGSYNVFGTNWAGNNSMHTSRACADWQLGLRWHHMFSDNSYGLTLEAGYEQHIYWSMYQSTIPGANAHSGNLTFDGWTFMAKFDF